MVKKLLKFFGIKKTLCLNESWGWKSYEGKLEKSST